MNKAQELINKYNLKPNSYYPIEFDPYKDSQEDEDYYGEEKFKYLKHKYKDRVPKKWYGFNGLGKPTPYIWYLVLDELLVYIETECPDFEIYQIKVKFGGIRIYLGKITNQIQQEISELTSVMTDVKLVY